MSVSSASHGRKLTFEDTGLASLTVAMVRAAALTRFPDVVRAVGGDPDTLLTAVGIDPSHVGRADVFIRLGDAVRVVEVAAETTATADFGLRLAAVQGIDILGPVGVAARTSGTVAEALQIFARFIGAHSPGLRLTITDQQRSGSSLIEYQILDADVPASPQHAELALGVILRVLRHLLGELYRPLRAHLPHHPLSPEGEYRELFGCEIRFGSLSTGLVVRNVDMGRPLRGDEQAHRALVEYLQTIVGDDATTMRSVQTLVRTLLPGGQISLDVVARQMNMHPKALQRRLRAEGSTFFDVVDAVRRDTAHRLLRDTRITTAHLARELGYAEQSVLTRSCHRWFGAGPAAYRRRLSDVNPDRAVRRG